MLIKHKRTDMPKYASHERFKPDERVRCPICKTPTRYGSQILCPKCR